MKKGAKAGGSWPRRKLSESDKLKLWGESYRLCNRPDCRKSCIIEGEEPGDGHTLIGEHAHIVAHADGGPRGDPLMPPERRASLDNYILLCRHCHKMVDLRANEEKYPKELLRQWKSEHQTWLAVTVPAGLGRAEAAEIKVVCEAVMGDGPPENAGFVVTEITEKIDKNGLSPGVRLQLRMGLGIADRVSGILKALANVDPQLPDKTRDGFAAKYNELSERHTGDDLFYQLQTYAAGGTAGMKRQSAALALLAYFFHACDVFEA